ncbi:MAG: Co2+/Mg2+ efflux protein ApaG [Alphaproteobacteria bacterium]
MYSAITRGIRVTVTPRYMPERSSPADSHYFWAYEVEITNLSIDSVQLRARFWRITDASGRVQEVQGPGVVGEQPIIESGDAYSYTSGCPLTTPTGIMVGSYTMVTSSGHEFEAEIPAFSLDIPNAPRVLN